MKMIALGLTACLALMPAAAGELQDGFAALEHKDYARAHLLLLPLANKGNAAAQFNIGAMYAEGWGVKQDEHEAAAWYLKAAQQDNEDAQLGLAMMYAYGRGVEKDYKEAMQWYLRAAGHGNALAQNNIGSLYFNGNGVPKDDARAVEWEIGGTRRKRRREQSWWDVYQRMGRSKGHRQRIGLDHEGGGAGLAERSRECSENLRCECQGG
jgi:TPR repeat protein